MRNPLECHGDLIKGACGCLMEKNFNIPVEKHPVCKVKEHQPIHKSYRKAANDKKLQTSFELKGKAI